ncbi:metallophosphoesterase family protein [Sporolactobacillus spathodeae]|uniref:DNA repair exonuclease SbcCD nuclease subunit n=1 Tax=Sporolactobacillus spathodeae TaxID=1465502 RepID=A0ABS2Q9C1_9BACL|nr:DNA repair exonuclease [Sporolactobacillus spathodeae]MBM7658364.1 DNA repair exonuclease SbcCD nuclease subunit [Sporolactobacillus spathodeae]
MIRFIHAADLHLDRPFEGLSDLPASIHERVKNSIFEALDQLVHHAVMEKVDFVILAGDIFDDSRRSIRAQKQFIRAMDVLNQSDIPVCLVFGNHDYLDNHSKRLDLPANVHVFPERPEPFRIETASGEIAAVYGFSYHRRHISEDMVKYFKKDGNADYHIGILHGAQRMAASEDVYAPFTIEDLRAKAFDYWALGHIHKRESLASDPPIEYSGDIQGLSIKETGEKGISLVALDASGAHVQLLPTASILWETAELSIAPPHLNLNDIDEALSQVREKNRLRDRAVFLRVKAIVTKAEQEMDVLEQEISDLIDAGNDAEVDRNNFVWLLDASIDIKPIWSHEEMLARPNFIGDLFRTIDAQTDLEPVVQPLLAHRQGRRYLRMPDDNEAMEIRQKAEQILAEALLRKN